MKRKGAFSDDDDHDPFGGCGENSSSDESLPQSGENGQVTRDLNGGGNTSSEESEDDKEGDDAKASSGDDAPQTANGSTTNDREALRQLMNSEQKTVATSIAQASRADAAKGAAIQLQRKGFDSLLNTRIKLQPAIVALNSLPSSDEMNSVNDGTNAEAIDKAFDAATKLWNTIADLRHQLQNPRKSDKQEKKRLRADASKPLSDLWEHMQDLETDALPHRRSILQKWSAKTAPTTTKPTSTRLDASAAERQSTILDVIDTQLVNKQHLVDRARVPRSCAPLQAGSVKRHGVVNNGTNSEATKHPPVVYDDADLYSILLKELLDQRTGLAAFDDAKAETQSGRSSDAGGGEEHFDTIRRAVAEAGKKFNSKARGGTVDTRASKGRRLRYNVHEKLQSFMAPEDRGRWGRRQTEELFGSLLGLRGGVGSGVNGVGEDEEGGEEGEEQALRLFRS